MNKLKKKLLSLRIFIENEWFYQMLKIIKDNKKKNFEGYITEIHHIIPKCWFKNNGLPVDNSEDNLVTLKLEDHWEIHKLMSKCSIGNFKKQMIGAMYIIGKRLNKNISTEEHNEYKLYISETLRGRKHSKEWTNKVVESRRWYKHSEETKKKIGAKSKNRIPNKETRKKMSISHVSKRNSNLKTAWGDVTKIKNSKFTNRKLAKIYNVSPTTIYKIRHYKEVIN